MRDCLIDEDFNPAAFDQGLTPLWAQKMAGVDLSKKYVSSLNNTRSVNVGVWDDGFDLKSIIGTSNEFKQQLSNNPRFLTLTGPDDEEVDFHGTSVSNLIAGYQEISGGVNGTISILQSLSGASSFNNIANELISAPETMHPEIVNISHDNKPILGASFNSKELNQVMNDSIFVCSAGNYYPAKADDQGATPCIQVGSVNFDGALSSFSMEGDGVDVLAPSDNSGLSIVKGTKRKFGGTSGASPLVAGVLSDFFSIFPAKVPFTKDQIRILFKNTSIRTDQIIRSKNGNGIINPLKLMKVGNRLNGGHFDINSPELYDFEEEVVQLQLQSNLLMQSENCSDKQKAYGLLREAFYLSNDTSRKQIAKKLSKLNMQNNAFKNAEYFNQFFSNEINYQDTIISLPPHQQEGYARFWFDMEKPSLDAINTVFSKLSPEGKIGILKELALEKRGKEFFDKVKDSTDKWHNSFPLSEYSKYLYENYY